MPATIFAARSPSSVSGLVFGSGSAAAEAVSNHRVTENTERRRRQKEDGLGTEASPGVSVRVASLRSSGCLELESRLQAVLMLPAKAGTPTKHQHSNTACSVQRSVGDS